MKKTSDIKKIKCDIFKSKNNVIEGLTKAINEAGDVEKKARFAEKLIKETDEFLVCEHFNKNRADCKICQYIAKLRKQTANLIIKAKGLKT